MQSVQDPSNLQGFTVMDKVVFIGNIEDQVIGSIHQVTIERFAGQDGEDDFHIRINGTAITKGEFHGRIIAAYLAWQDSYAGFMGDLDQYLIDKEGA